MSRTDRTAAERGLLFAAAYHAQVAAEALMRAAREDEPVDAETLEKLADAGKMLIESEFDLDEGDSADTRIFYEAQVRFIDGWIG